MNISYPLKGILITISLLALQCTVVRANQISQQLYSVSGNNWGSNHIRNSQLVISDGKNTISMTKDDHTFSFNGYEKGDEYKVFVVRNPENRKCFITNATGIITSDNVNNLRIYCHYETRYFDFRLEGSSQIETGIPLKLNIITDDTTCFGVIDWGDGTEVQDLIANNNVVGLCVTGGGLSINHSFTQAGVYFVSVRIYGNDQDIGIQYFRVDVKENAKILYDGFEQ